MLKMKISDKLFCYAGFLHLRSKLMKETSEVLHFLVKVQASRPGSFTKKQISSLVLFLLIYDMAVIPGRSLTTDAEKMSPELILVVAFWLFT